MFENPTNFFFAILEQLRRTLPKIFTFVIRLPRAHPNQKRIRWTDETRRIMRLMPQKGIFLTGIENSDPVVNNARRNQLKEAYDFEAHYKERLRRIQELGITWLRFGPPYSQAHPKQNQYDFTLTDQVVQECHTLGITLIADLLHFGLPDWLHHDNPDQPFFQNELFPPTFAKYAADFAQRYPNINHFTIINEPFVTANISTKVGVWNEARRSDWQDDRDFVRAVKNVARAAILARQAIEQVWQDEHRSTELFFVQNESFEIAIAQPNSHRAAEASQFNLRKFSALDLMFGHNDDAMHKYLLEQGLTQEEYVWFMNNGTRSKTILGIDHYPWCVYKLDEDTTTVDPLEQYALYDLTKMYYDRYQLPLLHTEINGVPELAIALCQKTYDILKKLNSEGYPVIGMGWYGDEYQVGWQTLLQGNDEYPVGLHYKGEPQPVALLFQKLHEEGLPNTTPQWSRILTRIPKMYNKK